MQTSVLWFESTVLVPIGKFGWLLNFYLFGSLICKRRKACLVFNIILHTLGIAGPQIVPFCSKLFCYNIDEGKKLITGWVHCPCGVCMFSLYLHVFSLGTSFSFHIPKMCTLGESVCVNCQSECMWVWVALGWKGDLSRGRSHLVPWPAGRGSGHCDPELESTGWKIIILFVFITIP